MQSVNLICLLCHFVNSFNVKTSVFRINMSRRSHDVFEAHSNRPVKCIYINCTFGNLLPKAFYNNLNILFGCMCAVIFADCRVMTCLSLFFISSVEKKKDPPPS